MLSTYYVNDFNLFGKTYRVQVEAKPQFRTGPQDIGKLYVRSEPRGHGAGRRRSARGACRVVPRW